MTYKSQHDFVTMLIWSKDRASQLHLLLESISELAPFQFNHIYVLYKADGEFKEGYKKCEKIFPDVKFVEETDFNKQTKEIANSAEYLCVSTDDTVLVEEFTFSSRLMNNVDIFSLRLSPNSIVQEPFTGRIQPALNKYVDEGKTVCWDSRLYHPLNNFGFRFGHDCVIYSKRYSELIQDANFKKTNELEIRLFNNCQHKINPFIRSFKTQKAVNIPVNNISQITRTDNSVNLVEANNKYLDGYKLNLYDVLKHKIVGCHQIININWVKEKT